MAEERERTGLGKRGLARLAVDHIAAAGRWVESQLRPRTLLPPAGARSVLVLEYQLPLGSCVHMTPLYEALKRGTPARTVTVATRGLGLQVLRHSPFVDALIETPDPLQDVWTAAKSLARQMKEQGIDPDCCLTGVPDQRTRIALVGLLACRGWRGGFTVQRGLYQWPLEVDRELSQIANNLRLAKLVGCPGELLEPRVFYGAAEVEAARRLLEPLRAQGRAVLAAVTTTSGGQRTRWHEERWVEVLRMAHQELEYGVVFVGTAADGAAIGALNALAGGFGVSLAGRTNVGELAALLALADMVVSLDTGTMHVARAVGTPMVVLGPSWQRPHEWLPMGKPQVRILRGEDRVGVPEGYQLDEIEAEAVAETLRELTRLYPADEAAREARLALGISPEKAQRGGAA